MIPLESPAVTHRRSIAMIAANRRGEAAGVGALLAEVVMDPAKTGALIASLLQVCTHLGEERPEDFDRWLDVALLHLAAVQDTPPAG